MTEDGEKTGEICEHLIRQKEGFNKARARLEKTGSCGKIST